MKTILRTTLYSRWRKDLSIASRSGYQDAMRNKYAKWCISPPVVAMFREADVGHFPTLFIRPACQPKSAPVGAGSPGCDTSIIAAWAQHEK